MSSPSLIGMWELDRERSDLLSEYLEHMGISEMAQKAANKLDVVLSIDMSGDGCTLIQQSRLGTKTRVHHRSSTVSEEARDSTRTTYQLVAMSASQVQVVIDSTRGRVIDTRLLEDDGRTLHQWIKLSSAAGDNIDCHRYYRRRTFEPLDPATIVDDGLINPAM